jgi:hypothetical protein
VLLVVFFTCALALGCAAVASSASAPLVTATLGPNQSPTLVNRLQSELALADSEMQAARQSATLAEARHHAEAVVNILVGKFGRWYGDQDGDGATNDPSDGSGVLPGEKIPEAAPDAPAEFPFGAALVVYSSNASSQRAIQTILGDVTQWRVRPRLGYDTVERALAGTDLTRDAVSKLNGSVPRAVVWARLILTRARSINEAQTYVERGLLSTRAALDAARSIAV